MTEEVPYREVHELLEQHGWVLEKSVTVGEELRRVYVKKDRVGPRIVLPVRQKTVLRAYLEKIKNVIQRLESRDAADE